MVRVDIWDVEQPENSTPIDCGFPHDFSDKYDWGKVLGKGGFGKVRVVTERSTGKEFACKSISKQLEIPNISPQKQAAHLDNVKQEISVLRRLRGTLNVAQFKEALEDDDSIHIVMEYCKGGELWNCIGRLHYSERTVASYMRAVLRTIAQCHYHRILHRDIKPGNFMLLEDDPLSPVKAIDFGLAVFFEPSNLPRRDLGLEGTPWFMSPEMLSAQVGPPSDCWAAGVMAYQLLSGYLPFDDYKNRDAPSLSKIWKAILTEETSFKGSAWQDVTEDAKDFVRFLLNKDPAQRPTAKEALQHKWVVGGHKEDRNLGAPLRHTVVQRIQRYAQGNALKRTIFELIAHEIIKMVPDTPDPSDHGNASGAAGPGADAVPMDESEHASQRAAQLLSNIRRRKSQRALLALAQGPGGGAMEGPPLIDRDHHSVHAGMEYFLARGDSVHNGQQALQASQEARSSSVHGSSSYWRVMRAAATALKWKNGSVHARNNYLRYMPRCEDEREEQRKVARLALDTSPHASPDFQKLLRQFSSPNLRRREADALMKGGGAAEQLDGGKRRRPDILSAQPTEGSVPRKVIPVPNVQPEAGVAGEEEQVRGRHAYRQFMEKGLGGSSGSLDKLSERRKGAEPQEADRRSASMDGRPSAARTTAQPMDISMQGPAGGGTAQQRAAQLPELPRTATAPVGRAAGASGIFGVAGNGASSAAVEGPGPSGKPQARKQVSFKGLADDGTDTASMPGTQDGGDTAGMQQPSQSLNTLNISEMKELMRKLNFTKEAEGVSEQALAEGLQQLGYVLQPDEMRMLAEQVDPHSASGAISKSAFLASQIDWHREDYRELWLEAAKKVFADLDSDSQGKVSSAALLNLVREKVPSSEVDYAVEDALVEAGYADEEEVDFEGFLRILRADSMNSLDQFEARLPRPASQDALAAMATSPPGSLPHITSLPSVAEES